MSSQTLKYFAVEILFWLIKLFCHFLLIFLKMYFTIDSSNWKLLLTFSEAPNLVSVKLLRILVLFVKLSFGLLETSTRRKEVK